MSVESLAGEVRSNVLANSHVIKSGDQAYYGDKQVFTTPELEQPGSSGQVGHEALTYGNSMLTSAFGSLKQVLDDVTQPITDTFEAVVHAGHDHSVVETLQKDVQNLKCENAELRKEIGEIRKLLEKLSTSCQQQISVKSTPAATTESKPAPADDDDDDFDMFGSDEDDEKESEEQKRIRDERLAAYAAKKSKKPGPIAKSSVILDVKPWDDETDLKELEAKVRTIQMDGLLWGASKLIPIGYGIQKLQIISTIEDDKVSVDADLVEKIQDDFAEFVQSVDIVAFNKI